MRYVVVLIYTTVWVHYMYICSHSSLSTEMNAHITVYTCIGTSDSVLYEIFDCHDNRRNIM